MGDRSMLTVDTSLLTVDKQWLQVFRLLTVNKQWVCVFFCWQLTAVCWELRSSEQVYFVRYSFLQSCALQGPSKLQHLVHLYYDISLHNGRGFLIARVFYLCSQLWFRCFLWLKWPGNGDSWEVLRTTFLHWAIASKVCCKLLNCTWSTFIGSNFDSISGWLGLVLPVELVTTACTVQTFCFS